MTTRYAVLCVASCLLTLACKSRQEAASALRDADAPASGKFVVAQPKPNPLKKADLAEVASRLEQILKDNGQAPQTPPPDQAPESEPADEVGLGLYEPLEPGDPPDTPNGVASLASISWSLGEVKAANEALKTLGSDPADVQHYDQLVQRLDAELNQKARKLQSSVFLETGARDKALSGSVPLDDAGVLRKVRDDALKLAVQQLSELKIETQGFSGMDCNVAGGSPTATKREAFREEDTLDVGQGLIQSAATQKVRRGEGVCFGLTPGYPLFTFVAEKRCASGFQPDDPRLTLHSSADIGPGEAFTYVLPSGDMLENVCFSRGGTTTMPVSGETPPSSSAPMAGAFKRAVSSVFLVPEDCDGVVRFDAKLCKGAECRAVASGRISDCFSKDCRAILLKRSAACSTTDCRGIIRKDKEECVSGYCNAVVSSQPARCWEKEAK